ncbi:ABC transporter substrate-binding protein [Massilia sp. TS11]|uniref:ABC transporter substrate-binding protein n=1 Tax=Massilia sp. TS11 TaxID=2908003 RepID=UPI001EDACCEE|nr:ABC transporter substrate-binding protein [Massilia sp. TS11]MCG2585959.1 ABC transporter substrate-binding protein [Massilia sp. TS11]
MRSLSLAIWACLLLSIVPAQAATRLNRIKAAGTVRVCIWPDYYSITYRDPKTQELGGVDIEMARALGQELGVRVAFVDSSFASLIEDVSKDRCDIAMFAIGITPARAAHLRFTSPHLASDIYAIATRANRRLHSWDEIDTAGTVVAVAKGTLHESVMRDKLHHASLLVLDTPFAREQEVQSGRADVFMTDYPYGQRFIANAEWARLIAPPKPYHITPYAYAIKPGDAAWHARLEQFVRDIKRDGRLAGAAAHYGLTPILAP